MRTSKFTEMQITTILKQGNAGLAVKDLCRQAGISTATNYQWRSKYGGLEASELRRVKDLEAENAKLKRMCAEMALDNAALKDLIAKKLQGRVRNARLCVSSSRCTDGP
jgi:putative transposase